MKKTVKILIIVIMFMLTCFLLCYWVGTWNFSIIKPTLLFHFDYTFDMLGSVWICESHNLEAVVTDNVLGQCIIITDLNTNLKYNMQERSTVVSKIYPYKDNPTLDDLKYSTKVELEFKKRWGKLCKFVIKGVNKDCWYESGDDSITFELVEEYSPEWWDEKQEPLKAY